MRKSNRSRWRLTRELALLAAIVVAITAPRATLAQSCAPVALGRADTGRVVASGGRTPRLDDRPDARSPVIAGVLGVLVPGVGHFYADEPGRGLALLAIHLGAGSAAFAASNRNVATVGAVVWLGNLIFSAVDAPLAARRFNARPADVVARARGGEPGATSRLVEVDRPAMLRR